MSWNCKFCSLLLAVILTLGSTATVLAQQSVTLSTDSDYVGVRWELQNGRCIIGLGNERESHSLIDPSVILEGDQVKVITKQHTETNVDQLQLLLGSRIYLNQLKQKGKNGHGFFAEGNLLVQKLDLEYKDYVHPENSETKDRVDTSISILAGYKFIFSRTKQKGLTLELAAGQRFNSGDQFHDYEVKSTEGTGMIGFGYTW